MSNDLQHETVLVTPPLPVWLFYHHNNSANHIAAHWHQAIELAGSIDRFKIDNQVYQTKPGQILVINSQVIHSIDITNHSDIELPTIKIAGIASRDYITCTLKNYTRSEPSYNDWKYRHYAKYIIFTNYRTHFDSLRVIRIILCY